MSEEMKNEMELENAEAVETAAEPVETMEDYAAELEASYKTLNKRNIEISEDESGVLEKWAHFTQMLEERTVFSVKIAEAVKAGVVAYVDDVRAFIPASQLSTEYVEKLEDWQGKNIDVIVITADTEKKRLCCPAARLRRTARRRSARRSWRSLRQATWWKAPLTA